MKLTYPSSKASKSFGKVGVVLETMTYILKTIILTTYDYNIVPKKRRRRYCCVIIALNEVDTLQIIRKCI